jgi:hypothetical protein
LLSALDGTKAFCARCHRRLSRDYARPLFAAGRPVDLLRTSEPDPTPAA